MAKKIIQFTKMHGLGNDLIFVGDPEISKISNPSEFAKVACDRNFGIGGDGLAFVRKSNGADADAEFLVFNSDGSEAMMCGNGIRCAAIFAYENKIVEKKVIRFSTKSGIKIVTITDDNNVSVDMGKPVIENNKLEVNGKTGRNVSMGNPHFVIVMEEIRDLNLKEIGPSFENASVFPNRTNTEFIKVIDRKNIEMRVFERGAGETLACGTGACASVVACAYDNLVDNETAVHLRGGDLNIHWDRNNTGHVFMTGPAVAVFTGKYQIQN